MKPSVAVALASQDANDRYLQYTRGSASCVRAEFEAADGVSAKGLHEALVLWAKGARTGATVVQAGLVSTINSCDPGAAYVPSPDHSNDALGVLTARNAIYVGVRQDDAPAAFSICYADAVVGHYSPSDLARLNSARQLTAAEETTLRNLGLGCRA